MIVVFVSTFLSWCWARQCSSLNGCFIVWKTLFLIDIHDMCNSLLSSCCPNRFLNKVHWKGRYFDSPWRGWCILNINSTNRKIILKYTQNNKLEPWLIIDFLYFCYRNVGRSTYIFAAIPQMWLMWKRVAFLHFISLHAECDLCRSSDKPSSLKNVTLGSFTISTRFTQQTIH